MSYLSLTRGEGGQNCLGPESGAALGVLCTGEWLVWICLGNFRAERDEACHQGVSSREEKG